MRRSEFDSTDVCAQCGESLGGDTSLPYCVSGSVALCYECAKQRGGAYDSETETWRVPPRLTAAEKSHLVE